MIIRKTTPEDFEQVMKIYARARDFMAQTGNPRQWGITHWPPEDLIRSDIAGGESYVCEEDGRVIGTFYYRYGKDTEPLYNAIEDGAWKDESPYGVVHRIASDGTVRGTGAFCINWAYEKSGGHLRIDTHGDNRVMQNLLGKLGFVPCGTIYVEEDDDPRIAFEKTEKKA